MSQSVEEIVLPILLLGDPGCGKSTFLSRILSPPSTTTQPPPLRSLDQPYLLTLSSKSGSQYTLEFSDTSSPTTYTLLRPSLVVLCFDISCRASLESVQERWRKEVTVYFEHEGEGSGSSGGEVALLMLGLKRDLRGEGDGWVYPEEGHGLATRLRCDRYAECSALTGELVAEVREDLSRMAVATMMGSENAKSQGPSCRIM